MTRKDGKIRNIRLAELCADSVGTHLLRVNSSPGKEGRRGPVKGRKKDIAAAPFVQYLNNSLRHAPYATCCAVNLMKNSGFPARRRPGISLTDVCRRS